MESGSEKPDPRIEQLTAQLQQERTARASAERARDTAVAERDTAVAERDTAVAERDRSRSERDMIRRQHAATRAELESARNWNVGLSLVSVIGAVAMLGGGRR